MSLLYLNHFELNKPPFQITPDPDFFFSGGRRGDILAALTHVARHDEGISTLVAEVGSGKTLLARLMIGRLANDVSTVYLSNPCFNRDEIISAIGRDLGLAPSSASTEEKLAALQQELLRRHALGQRVLLVVDEAHAMPAESLEEIRLLSNLETGQHKLINIMLFGQPELDSLLSDSRLRQVRDRVIHRFELLPLQADEAAAYVDHRLRAAGWRGGKLFSNAAQNLLLKASGGRARRINLLADKAMLAAYAQGAATVEQNHVHSGVQELQGKPVAAASKPPRGTWAWVALAGLAAGVGLTSGVFWWRDSAQAARGNVASNAPAAPARVAAPVAPALANASPAAPTAATTKLSSGSQLGYTVQLATVGTPEEAERYLRKLRSYPSVTPTFVQPSPSNGKSHVAVYFGRFASERLAQQAMMNLPSALQANRPLLRSLDVFPLEPKP